MALGVLGNVTGVSPLIGPAAYGQASNTAGTIQGTVTDPSGAAVANARVTLTQPSTGFNRSLTSSGSGYYSLGSLTPGNYTVKIDAPGFAPTEQSIIVQVGQVTNGDIKLGVSGSTQQVEVAASAVAVDTEQTQIAGVLSQQQIQALPVNGRNFLDLAQLQPGVQIQDGTNFDPTKNGFFSISFGGRFGRTARIALDGLDISDENVGTTTQNISEDAIQEFQVAQSNLDISTSITSSGSVNIVSRTGTNTIHGDGRWLFRDKRAGGANFPGGQDNYLQRNDVAGGVGGPIIPDKAFYFFSGEHYTQHLQAPVSLSGSPFDQLSGSYSSPYKELDLLGRFDFNLPHGAHGFIRGAYFNNNDTGGFGGGNNYSPYLNVNNVPNVGGGLDFLTGTFSHSLRVGYFKFFNEITDASAITSDPTYNKTPGVALSIGAFASGANYLAPQQTVQTNKQFKYDGSWTKGNHTLRYGAGINHLQGGGFASFFGLQPYVTLDYTSYAGNSNALFPGGAENPQNYIVNANPSANAGVTIGNGQGYNTEFAKFGYPGGGQEDWRVTAYLGDQWKIIPRVNLNYGVRYIRDTGRNDSDLPAIPQLDAVGPGLGDKVHQPNSNFGPQAGVAWDLTGKGTTVVRAGAGIYFENNVWNNVLFDRPVRLSQGLFFGDATICPNTSVPLPDGSSLTTVDGTTTGPSIASICGQQLGSVSGELATLEKTYQQKVASIGPASNGAYILNAMAVGTSVDGDYLFLPKYKTPESFQMNIGIQQQLGHNTVVTADYIRNVGQNFILGIDENHAGDVKNFNAAAAKAAVGATVAACGVASVDEAILSCPGVNGAVGSGATIGTFAHYGLDSINQSNGGGASANFAFPGANPNFGQMEFLTPGGRSTYNALEITVNKQARNVAPGVTSMNLTASYTYSHFNATGTSALGSGQSGGDQDFGAAALSMRNPSGYFGPSSLDRHQQFSVGLSTELIKGFTFDTIAHLYSSLPLTLSVPASGAGSIFSSDFDGDGTVGDVLPGTNVGSYMRKVGPKSINNVINNFNNTYAGTLTAAGALVVNSGALTAAQMKELGGTIQMIPLAPSNQVGNDILRIWDVGVGYAFKLGESLQVQPNVHAFNVLNAANFDGPGTVGGTRQTGVLTGQPGSANNTTVASQEPYRIGAGTGVYGFGAPRQLEFGMKVTF